MSRKISRRAFMSTTFTGVGAMALGTIITPGETGLPGSGKFSESKKLIATTDYAVSIGQCIYRKNHLDDLHRYLASVGVTRHHWIYEPTWDHYGIYPDGFDLLAEAVKSAHTCGIEFFAEIKPFEGGGDGDTYPLTLPFPQGVCALKDLRGIYGDSRPFTAAHPHLSLKRRPGSYEVKGAVSTIRLVKNDDKATRIKPGDLTILTSLTNNRFEKYNGPVSFRESVEWRSAYPLSRECRILHLEGLRLQEGHKYMLLKCSTGGAFGDFVNERGSIIELADVNGNDISCIISSGKVEFEDHQPQCIAPLELLTNRYFRLPELKEIYTNPESGRWHYQDFYSFDERIRINVPYDLVREGYIAVACGKPEYMLGNLHPIYPEVRANWLDMIRYCLDRGADGINIRTANHTRSPEDWEYGFNEPVIELAKGRTDYPTIRRINGNAYTQFLREAKKLVKSRRKTFCIQLYSQMVMPDDRVGRSNYIPPNFEWQWETWVREIADELEFRGAWTLRPENLRQVLETFASVANAANKPFYFQGNMKELSYDGPHQYRFTRNELDMVKQNADFNGFVLYETGHFTRKKEDNGLEGSPELGKLLKEYKWD